jgi:hypothetical protein
MLQNSYGFGKEQHIIRIFSQNFESLGEKPFAAAEIRTPDRQPAA